MMPITALLLAAAAVPQPADLKTFGDWTVGCDNGRACHATSLIPEGGDWERSLAMSVTRGPEPKAPVVLTIMANEGKVAGLTADGKPLQLKLSLVGEGDTVVEPRDVPAALAALRSASSIAGVDAAGTTVGSVSLRGASAALLYIDEAQRRIGTETAIVRPGGKPAGAVPAPPILPKIRAVTAPGAALLKPDPASIEAARRRYGCIPEEKGWPGYDIEQEPIDADHSLILMGCGAGAYNFSSVPLIASRKDGKIEIALADFDLRPSWSEDGVTMLVNAGWVAEEGLLTSFAKGRGIGDCGVGSDYAWDGTRFRLAQQIEMGECRGSTDYITTWRADVTKG